MKASGERCYSNHYDEIFDEISDDEISGFANTTKFHTTKFLSTKFSARKLSPPGQYTSSNKLKQGNYWQSVTIGKKDENKKALSHFITMHIPASIFPDLATRCNNQSQ